MDSLTPSQAPRRATWRFMFEHPAHALALGFGSGLSPRAPGTVGSLWAWAAFLVLDRYLGAEHTGSEWGWAACLVLSLLLGWWACTRTAEHLRLADPGAIVWDEVVAFWLVLWVITPAPWWQQALAFGLFRYFDAAKPGPVAWADRAFKDDARPWARGCGILWDDLVAAGCTLMSLALLMWVLSNLPALRAT